MNYDIWLRIVACISTSVFFFVATHKCLGAMQQSGYNARRFLKWLKRKDNLYFNRLSLFSLLLFLFCAITSLSFSFLGNRYGVMISALPFLGFCVLFCVADGKYALKIPVKYTPRLKRLSLTYLLFIAVFSYLFISVLYFVKRWINVDVYSVFAYLPYAVMPMFLPVLLIFVNGVEGYFERRNNAKFVKKATQKLNGSPARRIAVVGSYGKTTVKHILATLLGEEYSVCFTPQSYNTPIGVAKTVLSKDFDDKQIFIAEMGARKKGDIQELCEIVKPDYALLTGVCGQHVESFGSIKGVAKAKAEVLAYAKTPVLCSEKAYAVLKEYSIPLDNAEKLVDGAKNVKLFFDKTEFDLPIYGKMFHVETTLLGMAGVENISLAVALCERLGMDEENIKRGIAKIQPTEHRLQLSVQNGIYILDDSYNANPMSAKEGIDALLRFNGRKFIVTPGIVETGVLEETINGELGSRLVEIDEVILVGDTLVGTVKEGYISAGGDAEKLRIFPTLQEAQGYLAERVQEGDAVLFLNDLPDVY